MPRSGTAPLQHPRHPPHRVWLPPRSTSSAGPGFQFPLFGGALCARSLARPKRCICTTDIPLRRGPAVAVSALIDERGEFSARQRFWRQRVRVARISHVRGVNRRAVTGHPVGPITTGRSRAQLLFR